LGERISLLSYLLKSAWSCSEQLRVVIIIEGFWLAEIKMKSGRKEEERFNPVGVCD